MVTTILGRKLGMTQVWSDDDKLLPVTVIEAGPCVVSQVKTDEARRLSRRADRVRRDQPEKKVNKPMAGPLRQGRMSTPKRHLAEIRLGEGDEVKLGQKITVRGLRADVKSVHVTGTSKGKGFAGVMKRHNFKGGPGGHGSHFHRAPGSSARRDAVARLQGPRSSRATWVTRPSPCKQPRGRRDRRRAEPAARQGRGPGRQERPADHPHGLASRLVSTAKETIKMAKIEIKDTKGKKVGHRRARRRRLRHRAEHVTSCTRWFAARWPRAARARTTRRRAARSRGGGAKPWRQKGTGRARAGLDPLAAVGRRRRRLRAAPAQLRFKVPNKVVKLAMRSALSDKARRRGRCYVVDALRLREAVDEAGRRGPQGARDRGPRHRRRRERRHQRDALAAQPPQGARHHAPPRPTPTTSSTTRALVFTKPALD